MESFVSTRTDNSLVRSVLRDRNGAVLGQDTIVKADRYEREASTQFGNAIFLAGAARFRQVDGSLPLFATAQPTVMGARTIVKFVSAVAGKCETSDPVQSVIWINVREEPHVFIEDTPYVLREVRRPFQNIDAYKGQSPRRLEAMESRLCADIVKEAETRDGLFLLHDELSDRLLVPSWTCLREVKPPRDVYESLSTDSVRIVYARIPMSSSCAPIPVAYDALRNLILRHPVGTPVVIQCQSGRGRSTCALAITYLLKSIIPCHTAAGPPRTLSGGGALSQSADIVNNVWAGLEELLGSSLKNACPHRILDDTSLDDIHRAKHCEQGCEYGIIMALMKLFRDGNDLKSRVDLVIDQCDAFVNLREATAEDKAVAEAARTKEVATLAFDHARRSLERYYSILNFAGYLQEELPQSFTRSYSDWLENRQELQSLQERLKKTPIVSLLSLPSLSTHFHAMSQRIISQRRGNVLSRTTILKADHYPTDAGVDRTNADAINFREAGLAQTPIYGLAMPTRQGILHVLNTVSARDQKGGVKVMWFNLREEPVIYIGGRPFVLRNADHPFQNLNLFAGITPARALQMERRLKDDILAEAAEYNGRILVHEETEVKTLEPAWLDVDCTSVLTSEELYTQVGKEWKNDNAVLEYHRVPITPGQAPEVKDIDGIIAPLEKESLSTINIVFNCQMGSGRSTVGMICATLYCLSREPFPPLRHGEVQQGSLNLGELEDFDLTLSLVRLIRDGTDVKEEVDRVIHTLDQTENILECVHDSFHQASIADTVEESDMHMTRAQHSLERYVVVLLFDAYLHARAARRGGSEFTFAVWLDSRPEIKTVMAHLREKPRDSLRLHKLDENLQKMMGQEGASIISNRSGNVLTCGTLLKADYFPGSQRKELQSIPGVRNYRRIDNYNVYGTAIPTRPGVKNVLEEVRSKYGSKTGEYDVFWISLREEPVIYVNSRPFVLRNSKNPYQNMEHRGINAKRLEAQEARLKEDILQEAKAHDGMILLHDETPDLKIMEVWEQVSERTVCTPSEMYEQVANEGFRVKYLRLPITDEKAPKEKDFDYLLRLLCTTSLEDHLIFNCQMGRGRTTTAMIVSVLWRKLRYPELPLPVTLGPKPVQNPQEKLLRGEYQTILRLVRLLENGVQQKETIDACIDLCSHMQNLREAIQGYVDIIRTKKDNARAVARAEVAGHNYLVRYFFLIAFNSYLHEYLASDTAAEMESFKHWLKGRQEIYSLLNGITLE